MKPLSKNQIKMVREIEKEKDTFEPKKIWLRAWEIMKENNKV